MCARIIHRLMCAELSTRKEQGVLLLASFISNPALDTFQLQSWKWKLAGTRRQRLTPSGRRLVLSGGGLNWDRRLIREEASGSGFFKRGRPMSHCTPDSLQVVTWLLRRGTEPQIFGLILQCKIFVPSLVEEMKLIS